MKKQMKRSVQFGSLISFLTFTPFIAFAQPVTDAIGVLGKVGAFFNALLPILISFGVIYFIWGVIQYVIGDTEEAKTKGKDKVIYGVIGLAVIISIWGLVTILTDTFGVANKNAPFVTNLVSTPAVSAGCSIGTKLQGLLDYVTCIIGTSVIPFLFAIAIVMFIWGAIKFFIIESDEEAKRTQGKQFMIWGIIAIAVMISIWGLVGILGTTFGVPSGGFLPRVRP